MEFPIRALRLAGCAWSPGSGRGPASVRATVLLVLFCGGCGHISNQAGTAVAVAAVAGAIQVLAPPALEGRTGICPESREIRCVTTALCAHDERRACDFCRCAALLRGSVVLAP